MTEVKGTARRVVPGILRGERLASYAFLLVGLLGLLLVAFNGWIPHDEGTLAQAASRVLAGEWPHRDFHDTYGGLQAFLHAGAFKLLGVDLLSLRIVNSLVAAATALSVFFFVRRLQGPVIAGSAGAFVLLAGFAPYPSAMPSWWNTALATSAVLLLLKWSESGNSRHLALAGLLTGISFLIKLPGAYVGFGIVLYLLIKSASTRTHRRLVIVAGAVVMTLFGFVFFSSPSLTWFTFLIAPLATALYLGTRSAVADGYGSSKDFLRPASIFVASVLAPVSAYVIVMGSNADARGLIDGWFRLPAVRLGNIVEALSVSPVVFGFGISLVAISVLLRRVGAGNTVRIVAFAIPVGAAGLTDWSFLWDLLILLVVACPLVYCGYLAWKDRAEPPASEQLLLALCLASFAFIQFPFSNPIYALYTIPMAVCALATIRPKRDSSGVGAALALLVVSVGVWGLVVLGHVYVGFSQATPVSLVNLDVERGGVSVWDRDAFYIPMVEHLHKYAGKVIYAGPDAPEVYFLAGAVNSTPILFDFLALDWDYERLETLVLQKQFAAIVVNNDSEMRQSEPIPPGVIQTIQSLYPIHTRFGWFDVYELQDHGQ